MILRTALSAPPSYARRTPSSRARLRIGVVQHAWQDDPAALQAELESGIAQAAEQQAQVVFLPELTLSRYPADVPAAGRPAEAAEDLLSGPTSTFARLMAREYGLLVHASMYERADDADGLGYNTAVLVAPHGELLGRTRKLHIPVTEGYHEDTYFRGGPAQDPYPVYRPDGLGGAALGMPTCWDEWFPEVARAYALAGADVLVYPTAIGSEPDFAAFDTQPLWQQVIVANGIANGTFMVVPNRTGNEGTLSFYGSSFVSDPYGRVLVQAPRDEPAVLVADLDLDQRRDWLDLFPFLSTRRPDTYGVLTAPVDGPSPSAGAKPPGPSDGAGASGGAAATGAAP